MIRFLIVLGALSIVLPAAAVPLDLPAPSPAAEVSQVIGATKVSVKYSSPGKKGRTIWGKLVPYGELWRTGANGATTLQLSNDVMIGNQSVPAGTYSLFTIPGKKQWTVIINKNPKQGGTRQYNKDLDQARFVVKPVKAGPRERLTFVFSDTTDSSSSLDLLWDRLRVSLPITIDTAALVTTSIKGYANSASRSLARAAMYYADNKDLTQARTLIDASISIEGSWFNLWIKADLLAKQGNYKAAYPLAEQAYELGEKAEYFFWKDKVKKALTDWKAKR